jgi:hypothetical protein
VYFALQWVKKKNAGAVNHQRTTEKRGTEHH